MEPGHEPNPWIGFAVRFSFGACFGALVGLGWFAYSDGTLPIWFWIVSAAMLCGILAARYGDDFWQNLSSW